MCLIYIPRFFVFFRLLSVKIKERLSEFGGFSGICGGVDEAEAAAAA